MFIEGLEELMELRDIILGSWVCCDRHVRQIAAPRNTGENQLA